MPLVVIKESMSIWFLLEKNKEQATAKIANKNAFHILMENKLVDLPKKDAKKKKARYIMILLVWSHQNFQTHK